MGILDAPPIPAGQELASAESRISWFTTVVGSYVEILPMTMSFATKGRPAWVEFVGNEWLCTASGRCYMEILDGLTGVQVALVSVDLVANTRQPAPRLGGRIPAGTSLRFYKVLVSQPAAGTLTVTAGGLNPIIHRAVTM